MASDVPYRDGGFECGRGLKEKGGSQRDFRVWAGLPWVRGLKEGRRPC